MSSDITEQIELPETAATRRDKRNRRFGIWTAIFGAALIGAAGFLVGVEIQKGQASDTAAGGAAGAPAGLAQLFGGGAGAAGAGGAGGQAAGGGQTAANPFGAAGGFTTGSVKLVDGNTLYVTDAQGTTKKVALESNVQIVKTAPSTPSSAADLKPGDSVTVVGEADDEGTIKATRVTNNGTTTTG